MPLAELLGEHAADRVGTAAGGERDDQANRALGIAPLGGCRGRQQGGEQDGDGQACGACGARATMDHRNSSDAAGLWFEDIGAD